MVAEQSKLIENSTDKEIAMLVVYCMNLTGFSVSKIESSDRLERDILIDFLKVNFKKTTVDEVKLAFTFAIMEQSEAEIRHFQSFSAAYISHVINAYSKRKKEIKENFESKRIMIEEKKEDLDQYQKDMFEGLKEFYEKEKIFPKAWNWSAAFLYAERIGFIKYSVAYKKDYFAKVKKEKEVEANKLNFTEIKAFIEQNLNENSLVVECRKRLIKIAIETPPLNKLKR